MNMTTDRTHLPFDLSTSAALHTAAQQMQGSSPFAAAVTDLQLPRIALSALRRLAEVQATTPLGGRFVRWELCGAELWLGCALDQLDTGLAAGLPSCRVGSVEGIEVAQRVEFLAAVVAAFPLTDASTFHCRLPDAEQVLLAATAAAAAAAPVAAPAAALAKAASKPHTAVAAKREVKREVMLVAAKAKSAAPCRNYSRGARDRSIDTFEMTYSHGMLDSCYASFYLLIDLLPSQARARMAPPAASSTSRPRPGPRQRAWCVSASWRRHEAKTAG